MCVTNTTNKRPVTLTPAQVGSGPSALSQRICSSLFLGSLPRNVPAVSTTSTVPVKAAKKERKRKPQKPGKTAKNHDRHFVVHDYHDHSHDANTNDIPDKTRRRGGVSMAFPMKLHALLDQIEADGLAHVISWQPHGRCFLIHDPKEFTEHVMPNYFKQTKLTSFQRQLNLYGFQRLTRGQDAGGYYHELFLRGKTFLCKQMTRTKIKGTGFKAASSPDQEPDFWRMAPVNAVTPVHSSDDDSSIHSDHTAHSSVVPQEFKPPAASNVPPAMVFNHRFTPVRSGPLPIPPTLSFNSVVEQPQVPVASPVAPVTTSSSSGADSSSSSGSEVLDEIVDELIIESSQKNDTDILDDFVHDWATDRLFDVEVEDDRMLGEILERILED